MIRRKYATDGAVQSMTFMEDAKGNKYDVAGNILPPADAAIKNALTTARAETYDPYAEEIASAKKLMADQAYQNQSWSDWAGDVGQNLYNTGMSFLPTALGGRGEVGLSDIAKGMYESGKSAATLPGDVLTGKTKVFDPTSGGLTDEVLRRGSDFTGFMTLGAGAIPAEANTLRMGMKGVPPSPEDAALKAAQEATGGDDVAAATRAAQLEALNPVPPPQGIAPPSPEHALGTQRATRTVIAPTSIKLNPAEQAIVNKFKSRADRALVASRIRETKARYPKSDGWSPFEAVGASIDDKGNPVIEWQKQKYGFNTARKPGVTTEVDPVTGAEIDVPTMEEASLRPNTPEYERAANKAARNGVKEVENVIRRAAEGDEAAMKIIRQAGWYREFMRKGYDERGGSYPAFSDLLGATSPNTAVDQNYRYSVDIQNRFARGDFDDPVRFAREYDGDLNKFPADKLIYRDPVGPKGPRKLQYGMNSRNAQMALADKWRKKEPNQAPKARNFSGNLGGATDEATIDVWAARFANRMAGRKRLPPPVEDGVRGKLGANLVPKGEFGYGQDVFRRITDELNRKGNLLPYLKELGYENLTPMDMQALTWFIEKEHWTKNNWTTAAGEGGSFEDELLKYPSERWLSGVSIEQKEPPSDAAMAYTRNVFENSLRDDPNVNQYRVHPTIGRYDGYNERSFDLELTAKPGWNPRTWMAAVIREAQANNQKDVFFSKRLSPEIAQGNPNARPGVEIYFRDRKTLKDAMPILEEFTKRNSDGFTFVTDLRLRERELGGKEAPDFVGIRLQWVPEIRSRFDEDFRNAVAADPAVLDSTADEALDAMQSALLALDKAGLGIVDARVHHYDTLTVGKESYDKFLDGIADPENAAGAYEGRTGAAVDPVRRFGQPLYSHVEGRNRALRAGSEGGQSNASGDVVGAGQPSGALERAQQQGFTTEAYRGSNRDIQEYGPRASESGYYGGKPTYFTSSPEDATGYTRVPLEEYEVSPYDQLKVLQETNPEATLQDVLSGKYPNLAEEYANRLAGGENLGAVYPSKLKMQNPVRVGGEGETVFKGEEAANLVKITANTLVEAGIPQETVLPILSKLDDMLQSGGFGAMDFDLAIRNAAKGVDRRLAAKIGSILTDVYQKAGFDSIDLDASVFSDRRAGSYSYPAPKGSRHYMVFDPENIRGRFAKFGGYGPEGPAYMKAMGGAVDDEDIDNALRLARAMGGRIGYAGAGSVPIMMEDAKGNKYDAQGNIIPPQNPGPNPQRSNADMKSTYAALQQAVPQKNMSDTYRALDSANPVVKEQSDYEVWQSLSPEERAKFSQDYPSYSAEMRKQDVVASEKQVQAMPENLRSMTHPLSSVQTSTGVGKVEMPLLGINYEFPAVEKSSYITGETYRPAESTLQSLYDFKTVPFYSNPFTAGPAAAIDVAEGVASGDPTTASLAVLFGPGGKYAKAAGLAGINYFMDPAAAQAGPARWFSKAMEVARAIPMEKMTGQQALAMLRKGVSPEELKWTGADAFLPQQKQITKQDLVDYLAKNRVQTRDVVLGGSKPTSIYDVKPSPTVEAKYAGHLDALNVKLKELDADYEKSNSLPIDDENYLSSAEYFRIRNDLQYDANMLIDKMRNETVSEMGGLGLPVRYGPGSEYGDKYMTRGGEDYRETLITLPGDSTSKERKLAELDAEATRLELAGDPRWRDVSRERGELLRSQGRNIYSSSHWEGVPNVAGHIRTQILDITPPGSNRPYKAFNVDEAQSDWAKAGREKGFGVPKEEYDKIEMKAIIGREKLLQHYESLPERHRPTNDEIQSDISRMMQGRQPMFIDPEGSAKPLVDAFINDYRNLEKAANALPVAPYVTSTQNWTDLSIKKALDQAMDSEADYFTYTPGKAQAQRYSLRNAVDEIQYDPKNRVLFGRKGGKNVFEQDAVEPEELAKYVGKEMSERLLSQPTKESKWYANPRHVLAGQELDIGGEGMIDYYDNIYKKRVEKVVKDATGKKVEWEVIPVNTADGPREQLGFRLTDDMKEARFSDFNKGGRVSNPVVNKALKLTASM